MFQILRRVAARCAQYFGFLMIKGICTSQNPGSWVIWMIRPWPQPPVLISRYPDYVNDPSPSSVNRLSDPVPWILGCSTVLRIHKRLRLN